MESDALHRFLLQRNDLWLLRRLPKTKEKDSIFSDFLPANLPVCAALLVLAQQVQDDVGRFAFRSDPCLLKLPNTTQAFQSLVRGGVLLDKRGAYLFFNTVMQY